MEGKFRTRERRSSSCLLDLAVIKLTAVSMTRDDAPPRAMDRRALRNDILVYATDSVRIYRFNERARGID
ncbi:hypothetical protein E2C01_059424 [Portunus trituberculatus]|uniref:Uncharacterized protein n=1 Tax=Portunus trituberculatus TaxID=210409 RepID=A0A5B7GY52_PORTR|nr:hypothetical protein [Portunus trituberculatus]